MTAKTRAPVARRPNLDPMPKAFGPPALTMKRPMSEGRPNVPHPAEKNGSNTVDSLSGGMPSPLSRTLDAKMPLDAGRPAHEDNAPPGNV